MSSTTVLTKKKRGPAPTGKGQLIGVRLQPDLLAALDAFIAAEGEGYTRPNTIRHILEEWLHASGYIKGPM